MKMNGKPVFALSGNPVSSMASFELFVRPSILKAMGHQRLFRPKVEAVLDVPLANSGKRPHLLSGVVSKRDGRYHVSASGNQGSSRLSSLLQGNGLIRLEPEISLAPGVGVEVMLLDRGFESGSLE